MISRKYKGEMKSKVLTVEEWKTLIGHLDLKIVDILEFPGRREPESEIKKRDNCDESEHSAHPSTRTIFVFDLLDNSECSRFFQKKVNYR